MQDGPSNSGKRVADLSNMEVPDTAADKSSFTLHIRGLWEDQLGKNLSSYLTRLFQLLDKFMVDEKELIDLLENMQYLCPEHSWEGVVIIKGQRLEVALYLDAVEFRLGSNKHAIPVDFRDLNTLRGASIASMTDDLSDMLFKEVSEHGEIVRDFPQTVEDCWQHIQHFNLREESEPEPE